MPDRLLVAQIQELKDIVDDRTEELRRSEERLRLAQAVASIGTFEWNVTTGLNVWTPELERMYGLAPGSFEGTQPAWESLVFDEDRAAALDRVTEALRTGAVTEGEWRVVQPDGTVRWLAGRFQAFFDDDGRVVRLMGVNIDITERKVAELEVSRLNEHLETLVRERTQVLERAVADLRQAMAEIKTLRGLLPLCAWCRKIRDERGQWLLLEKYLADFHDATVSHGICPDCAREQRRESERPDPAGLP